MAEKPTFDRVYSKVRKWPAVALGAFPLAVMRVDDRLLERWQAASDPLLPFGSSWAEGQVTKYNKSFQTTAHSHVLGHSGPTDPTQVR